MNKLNIVTDHNFKNPPVAGGIEKRIQALVEFMEENNKEYEIFTLEDIDKVKDGLVLGYNLESDICKYFDYKNLLSVNTFCSGFSELDPPKKALYSSDRSYVRFPCEALKKAYIEKKLVNEDRSFVLPHGMLSKEYQERDKRLRKKLIWVASLGWGWSAKGLDSFVELAYHNPDYDFEVFGGRWESDSVEDALLRYQSQYSNLKVNFDLKDEDKNKVFDNALALCQFTRLLESCNIVTLEAMTRGCPVITLPNINNGGVNENLDKFNFKLNGKFLGEDFVTFVEDFDHEGYKKRAELFSCEKEYEALSLMMRL